MGEEKIKIKNFSKYVKFRDSDGEYKIKMNVLSDYFNIKNHSTILKKIIDEKLISIEKK